MMFPAAKIADSQVSYELERVWQEAIYSETWSWYLPGRNNVNYKKISE